VGDVGWFVRQPHRLRGFEVADGQCGQRAELCRRGSAGRRIDRPSTLEDHLCVGVSALREGEQRDGAPRHGDDRVEAFAHTQQHGVSLDRDDREAVGVRDGHPHIRHAHAERGVRAGVDQPQPNPLARLHRKRVRGGRGPAVGEHVRVGHVTDIAAEQVRPRHRHTRHAAVLHGHAVGPQIGQHVIWGAAAAVQPVVQHDDQLGVVVIAVLRVLDDERGVQAGVQLRADVRVEPVRAGVGHRELVAEPAARLDLGLGEVRDAVHVVAQRDAVPVDRRRHAQGVRQVHLEHGTAFDADLPARQLAAVGPRDHLGGAEIHGAFGGRE
jgi:hypothetical protein